MLCSPPFLTRRSTIFDIGEYVVKQTFIGRFYEENKDEHANENELIGKARIEFQKHLIEEFTVEGICDFIQKTNYDDYSILAKEFGLILERSKNNSSYLHSIIGLLSKLYYAKGHSQLLSQRSKEGIRILPDGKYFTLLAEMQSAKLYINTRMLLQGFLRRFVFVPYEKKDLNPNDWKPPLDPERPEMWSKYEQFAKKIALKEKRLKELAENCVNRKIPIILDPQVREEINKYDEKNYKEAFEIEGDEYLYKASRSELLVKLSVIEALASDEVTLPGGVGYRVTIGSYKRARKFLDDLEPLQNEALQSILTPTVNYPIVTEENIWNKIMSVIRSVGGKIAARNLYTAMGMSKDTLKPHIKSLIEQKKLFAVVITKGKGRPNISFYDDKEKSSEKWIEDTEFSSKVYDSDNVEDFMVKW